MTNNILSIKNINNYNKNDLQCVFENNSNIKIFISNNCCKYLYKSKSLIDENITNWEKYKKITNIHEYIHTPPYKNLFISKIKPLSRSFYKLIEIINVFNLLNNFKFLNIISFHLAEGPGGFIQALSYLRENKKDKYIGMTLINEDINTPGWKKSQKFLNKNKKIFIEKGFDKTGNLYNSKNFKYCYNKYKNKINFITADGGFDFTSNYHNQEIIALRLIITQIFYALIMQNKSGIFVLKIFDIFTKATCDIIYLLSCFYSKVSIYKPDTSRSANSEKYIICENYINNIDLFDILFPIIKKFEKINFEKFHISSILNITYNHYFLKKINKINFLLGEKQILNIIDTINLIKTNKNINYTKKHNIKKSMGWCKIHNIPHNYVKIKS